MAKEGYAVKTDQNANTYIGLIGTATITDYETRPSELPLCQ